MVGLGFGRARVRVLPTHRQHSRADISIEAITHHHDLVRGRVRVRVRVRARVRVRVRG